MTWRTFIVDIKPIYPDAGAFAVHPKHDAALNLDGEVGGGDQSSAWPFWLLVSCRVCSSGLCICRMCFSCLGRGRKQGVWMRSPWTVCIRRIIGRVFHGGLGSKFVPCNLWFFSRASFFCVRGWVVGVSWWSAENKSYAFHLRLYPNMLGFLSSFCCVLVLGCFCWLFSCGCLAGKYGLRAATRFGFQGACEAAP